MHCKTLTNLDTETARLCHAFSTTSSKHLVQCAMLIAPCEISPLQLNRPVIDMPFSLENLQPRLVWVHFATLCANNQSSRFLENLQSSFCCNRDADIAIPEKLLDEK